MSRVQVLNEPNAGYVYASFAEFLSDVIQFGNGVDVRAAEQRLSQHESVVRQKMMEQLPPHMRAAAGMSEQIPADGGFLLQPQWARQIVLRSYQESAALRRVTEWQVSDANRAGLRIPAVDESSRADGSRWGGVRGYWLNEADTINKSKPRFSNIELNPKKAIALTYLTSELLADMNVLSQYLVTILGKELSFRVTDAVISGDGAGKPQGVLNSPAAISVSRTSGNVIVAADVLAMMKRFWVGSRTDPTGTPKDGSMGPGPKPAWYCHCDVIDQLATCVIAVGTGGSLAFLFNPETGIMMGAPVIPIEQCQALGTVGDLILADLNEYHLAWRNRGQLDISMHLQFVTDEQVMRLTYRVDGAGGWSTAVSPLNASNTQSPFVVLHA